MITPEKAYFTRFRSPRLQWSSPFRNSVFSLFSFGNSLLRHCQIVLESVKNIFQCSFHDNSMILPRIRTLLVPDPPLRNGDGVRVHFATRSPWPPGSNGHAPPSKITLFIYIYIYIYTRLNLLAYASSKVQHQWKGLAEQWICSFATLQSSFNEASVKLQ